VKARSRQSPIASSPFLKRQENVEAVAGTLDKPKNRDPNFRDMCLRRDNYCCVVTGQLETSQWEKLGCPDDVNFGPLEAAHIIPFAYASWDKSSEPPNGISRAWEVLWRCFPNIRKVGMQVENINDVSNGMALRNFVREEFGKFTLAFKPTDKDNVYELKAFRKFPRPDRKLLPENGRVEFTRAEDAQDLELPNAALLDCHYRIAEILNASGMAEIIESHY